MARRQKKAWGDGAVFESPKGSGIWWAQLPPDARGRRPKRRAASEAEAHEKLRELKDQRTKRIRMDKNPSVDQLFQAYIADLTASEEIKESTIASYEQVGKLYIIPHLGKMRARDVLPSDIRSWRAGLQQKYAPDTVKNAYARLHAALDMAVEDRIIDVNPVATRRRRRGKILTKRTAPKEHLPTLQEARHFRQAIADHRNALLFDCLILFGLRKGEALAPEWSNVNWNAATLTIERQVQTIRSKTKISPTPKTETSIRELPIPPQMLERFRAQLAHQQAEQLENEEWEENSLIFPSERGTPIQPRNFARQHKAMLKAAKLPESISLRQWRHFVSTRLDELGVSETVRGAILGHSRGRTVTQRYTHATLESMRAALEQLEALICQEAAA